MAVNSHFTSADFDQAITSCQAVIQQYQQPSGAYPASPNFKPYKYCWLRDGSFTADAMSRAGNIDSAEKFFDWCSAVISKRRQLILNGGKLDARYNYDGQESNEEWATYQLDGYGLLLWAIYNHCQRHSKDINRYQEATGLVQHYLASHWQEPCFDWWEERAGKHAASLACIYAGLNSFDHPQAPSLIAAIDLSSERVDASLLVCAVLDAITQDSFSPMLLNIETGLKDSKGGVSRYQDDTYYGGGQWPLLSAMLGWYYLKIGRVQDATTQLSWCLDQMQPNGWLPEQVSDSLLHPESYQPWVEKLGPPANPLLWSQAMVITLASELKAQISSVN